ncbi:hypothetical protein [Mesorhizobium sp.]|uniref:hypothetical protein n=1 Tax=Mesorhizobium sp. TaxID=1871066 RepID=UPI000FE70173|nr:hypothetical protein [Mesorhizobium sp.]RWM08950.1 MAG: hypothetical protein EOR71_10575 [Mesorhizobium sp.]
MAITVGTGDLYSDVRAVARRKLSAASAAFVNTMVAQAEDHRALWQSANDKQSKLLARLQEVEVRHEHIQRQIDHGYTRVETLVDGNQISAVVKLPANAPEVLAIRKELAEAQAEWEKQTAVANERGSVVRSHEQLLQSLGKYLDQVETKLEDAPEAKPPKKADVSLPAIEAKRAEIGVLKAALDANMAAPVATGQRKKEAAELVARLASDGIPRLDMAAGTLPFEFPLLTINHTAVGAVPGGREVVTTNGRVHVPNAIAVLCWLFPESMLAAIQKEIDLAGDDAAAVDDETRAKRDTEIMAQILEAEREEEMLIRAALSAGLTIQRRPGADVRAVLAIDGPHPAKL